MLPVVAFTDTRSMPGITPNVSAISFKSSGLPFAEEIFMRMRPGTWCATSNFNLALALFARFGLTASVSFPAACVEDDAFCEGSAAAASAALAVWGEDCDSIIAPPAQRHAMWQSQRHAHFRSRRPPFPRLRHSPPQRCPERALASRP